MPRKNNLKGAGPGRPTGSQNELNKTVQECILDAFHSEEIGGVNGLIEWGKQMGNREAFYKLVSRLIPIAEADKKINGKKDTNHNRN